MLFKRSEPKHRGSAMGLAVGALAVVGAIAVGNAAKSALGKIKSKLSSMCSLGKCDQSEADEEMF